MQPIEAAKGNENSRKADANCNHLQNDLKIHTHDRHPAIRYAVKPQSRNWLLSRLLGTRTEGLPA